MATDSTGNATRRFSRMKICINQRAGDLLPSCGSKGSKELATALQAEIDKRENFIALEPVHCLGKCHIGPTLKLMPFGPYLQGAQASDAAEIVQELEAENYEALERRFPDPAEFETVQKKL